jgi:Leucine-rich repeat (LRR) protein
MEGRVVLDNKNLSLTDVDDEVRRASDLKSLSAQGNNLALLPASLSLVGGLEKLVLSKNRIEGVSLDDRAFLSLQKFHATDNMISSFVFVEPSFRHLTE